MTGSGRIALLPALVATAVLTAACTPPTTTSTGAPRTLEPLPTYAEPSASAPAPTAAAPAATRWTMPNLVGTNLQAAQDRIQALTGNVIFVTTSHDATGAGRTQVLDRNWKVCSQNIRPGQEITADSKIDFGAVKIGEHC